MCDFAESPSSLNCCAGKLPSGKRLRAATEKQILEDADGELFVMFAKLICLSKSSVAEEYYAERSGNRWVSR